MDRDLNRTTLKSYLFSIASLHRADLRPLLAQAKIPAMGMYGARDSVAHPNQWQPLLDGVPHARIERFPDAGHFIMLDQPSRFMHAPHDFLKGKTPTNG
ncbi:MAG: hypothetical protein PHS96_06215 [Anaerolineales bacterium]|nr:hypothetical protein [Anaerolineales bacterium]